MLVVKVEPLPIPVNVTEHEKWGRDDMKEEVSIQKLINQLTEHRNSTENFLKSLRYIDNGLEIADFFRGILDRGYTFNIIRGFDYEIDGTPSEFREVLFNSDLIREDINVPDNIELIRSSKCFILILR